MGVPKLGTSELSEYAYSYFCPVITVSQWMMAVFLLMICALNTGDLQAYIVLKESNDHTELSLPGHIDLTCI